MQISVRTALQKLLDPSSNRKTERKRRSRAESLEKREMLTTFYVDDNVASGGDGTIESPFNSIQLAIDAAALNDGDDVVQISPGVYDETLTVNDTSGDLLIAGSTTDRSDVLILNSTDSASQINSIDINGSKNVTIQNVTFQAGDENVRGGYRGIWYHDSMAGEPVLYGLTVENVVVEGHVASGITLESAGELHVSDTIVRRNNNGIFSRLSTEVWLRNVDVQQNAQDGIQFHNGDSLHVFDSNFDENNWNGAYVRNIPSVEIVNSSFSRNNRSGFFVYSGNQEFNATGIDISQNSGTGITVQNSPSDFEILGGQIVNNNQIGLSLINVNSVAIDNASILSNNTSFASSGTQGGGINVRSNTVGATFSLTDSSVRDNVSGSHGGGIFVAGTMNATIEDSEITGNTAYNSGDGGGIYIESRATNNFIRRSIIADNESQDGGGLGFVRPTSTAQSNLLLEDTTVDGNLGRGGGGGIYLHEQSLTVNRSTISNNSTLQASGFIGGGLYIAGDAHIQNSTISGNFTNNSGGGIAIFDSNYYFDVSLRYVTITNNTSNGFGGGVIRTGSNNRLSTATSIIAGNNAADGAPDYYGEMASVDGNLIGDGSRIIWLTDMNGDQVGTSANPIDPLLGDLAENGGYTHTHALLPNSPAVDATGATNFVFPEDQRGIARPQGASRDIGAFELVPAPNTPPIATDDFYEVEENSFISIPANEGFLINDSDLDGDPLTYTIVDRADHGVLDEATGGGFYYRPNANFVGVDTFTYQIDDGRGGVDTAVVTINVIAGNSSPVGIPQSLSVDEEALLSGSVSGSDDDGDQLTFVLVDAPLHASSFQLNPDGSFTYRAVRDYNGPDRFTFQAFDGEDYSAVTQVSIKVREVNDSPIAMDDFYRTIEDTPLVVELPTSSPVTDQAHEDSPVRIYFDANINDLQQEVVAGVAGTLQSIDLYIHSSSYAGEVLNGFVTEGLPWQSGSPHLNFSYTVRPEDIGAWVSIDLTQSTSQIELAVGDAFTIGTYAAGSGNVQLLGTNTGSVGSTTYDNGILWLDGTSFGAYDMFFRTHVVPSVQMGGVLLNDTDVDGDILTVSLFSDASNGTVDLNSNGTFVYTPDPDFFGQDSFTYLVNDGSGLTYQGVVTIMVADVNDRPIASTDNFTVSEDDTLILDPSGILGNDSDVDGDTLTVSLIDTTSHGELSLNPDGSFTYTPDANYAGSDAFIYRIDDGRGGFDTARVDIFVLQVNDPPVAVDDTFELDEDVTLQISVPGVGENDTDIENHFLTFSLETDVQHGQLTFNTDGSFTYIPDEDFSGEDTFSYRVHDGNGGIDTGLVNLTINAVNDAPVAIDDHFALDEDTALNVSAAGILENDLDTELDSLVVALVDDVDHGTLTVNPDGSFSYIPDPDFHGTDTFTYAAVDVGGAISNTATVSLEVASVNDAPTIEEQGFAVPENSVEGTLVGKVEAGDVDGDELSFTFVDGNDLNVFSIAADGTITVADSAYLDFEQTAKFDLTVAVSDGTESSSAPILISLTDVQETLTPAIDIQPGDITNTIVASKNSTVEVALFGSATFDVSDVDISTIRFGETGTEDSLRRRGKHQNPDIRYEDINGDGHLDLIAVFETELTGLSSESTDATISGYLFDGQDFLTTDLITFTTSGGGGGNGGGKGGGKNK